MKIEVRDYRGAERVDAEVNPIALIAGRNGAGKTSVGQAVAAALTGAALPAGMTKKDAGALVRLGAGGASARVVGSSGSAQMTWPNCTSSTDGTAPWASRCAAGIESPLDVPAGDRARYFATLLKTDPTREDLDTAMADKGLADAAARMWLLIDTHGWDGAHQMRRDKGAELKGRWRQVTGQNYGGRIAAGWTPEHWSDDLAGETERELDAALADAKTAAHGAIAADAVSAARREALEREADALDERARLVEEAAREMTAIEADITALRRQRDELPATDGGAPDTRPCPHCGQPIAITKRLMDVGLEKPPLPADPTMLKQARRQRAMLDIKLSNAETRATNAKRGLTAAQAALAAAHNARGELAELPEAAATGGTTVADAEAGVTRAEQRLASFKAKGEADAIRDLITSNEAVIDLLAPAGLRARKLAQVLDLFNSQLAPLSGAAGWKPVQVLPDMAVTYGGRPHPLLSTSEQYRVRTVLQLAVARIDGSHMVVLDAADVLDAPTRGGLFSALAEAGVPALVAMTLSRREQVPDIAAAGLGRSYWIENGIAAAIDEPQQEAAC